MKIRGKLPEAKPTPHHADELTPGALNLDDERIKKAVAEHRGTEYVTEELMTLIENTLLLVDKHTRLFASSAEKYELSAEQAEHRIFAGLHLLDPEKLDFNEEALAAVLDDVLALASFTDEPTMSAMRGFIEKTMKEENGLTGLVRLSIARKMETTEKAYDPREISREAFYFLLHNLGAAVLPAFAQQLANLVEDEKWLNGTCPICGNQPAMAGLAGDGGKRHLLCGTCNFAWTYPRLKCPYCRNEDHEKLSVLTLDDDSPYRLDACKECNRYVKTLDYRKAPEGKVVLLPVEDAATVYLDIMASNEGFRRE